LTVRDRQQNLATARSRQVPTMTSLRVPFTDPGDLSMPVKLVPNPVFDDIKIGPHDQRKFVLICGYIGKVNVDSILLYPGLDLRCYYEIPIEAIKAVDKEDPLHEISPSRVLIDASTEITIVYNRSRTVEAGFLAGAILSGNQPREAGPYNGGTEGAGSTRNFEFGTNGTGPVPHSSPACTSASGKCNCLVASLERE
jgi:hypothetical protein